MSHILGTDASDMFSRKKLFKDGTWRTGIPNALHLELQRDAMDIYFAHFSLLKNPTNPNLAQTFRYPKLKNGGVRFGCEMVGHIGVLYFA